MERIEGLSIGLSLDSLKVESGLKNLNRQFSLVNSEMRANMSAFDRGERSVGKYETRLDGLNKKLDVQKVRVEAAQKSYEKMVDEHGAGSAEAEKAAIEYNKQSAALRNLESDISKTTSELKKFAEAQRIENSGWTKMGNAMDVAGTKLQSFGSGVKDLGGKMTLWLTAPIAALGATAIAKGLSRLMGIDEANAKLEGLGFTTKEIEKIMGSALDSVRGTSFGLDEAATTAANAVAAGVKEGKELTKYLSLTGDAAAIAGTNLSDMGGIFNKIQTSGKAYNGELQQLSDRGLPIYQWLAEEANTTADAVFDMASKGEISTDKFLKAIENNIGGAAQTMGDKSLKAGLANMWAAVGRLGANFLDAGGKGGGFFSAMKPLVVNMTSAIDTMSGVAEEWGVKFGEAFVKIVGHVKTAINWFKGLSSEQQKLAGVFAGLAVAAWSCFNCARYIYHHHW
ncbi:tape measure protein [Alkalicoccobacillus plakortidis]|uniref:Tape measure protein n=1 Tax=Alkalicoccobacillus plakortidis TaxID=444060 RepID=A0ABT0XI42_9BACI|nr:tape measure protein [Alkalicoccobacillus plakortidis]MCM2675575.1 tape measure protein [Alkalicoccobacillus plakortidis]